MSSPPNTASERIDVTDITIRMEQVKRWTRLRSGKLHVGPAKHRLIPVGGELRQQFPRLVELTPATRIELRYKATLGPLRNKVQLDTTQLFAAFSASQTEYFELSVPQGGIQVGFRTPLRFRILVIGKSGVGKSTLIRTAFGIDNAHSNDLDRGRADIEKGLESTVNNRFILHDSVGFEAADSVNYDTVKEFIRRRQTCAPKDRLHAVWFCVPVPRTGGRLLEAAAEDFFITKKETMGTIPIVVVYTKADEYMNEWLYKQTASLQKFDDDRQKKHAFSEAKSCVGEKHKDIDRLAGGHLPYAVVSKDEQYKHTLQELIEETSKQIRLHNKPKEHTSPEVIALSAAQRIDPKLKIEGTIDVGGQAYWNAVFSGAVSKGSIQNRLSVIHADIIGVWNFNDPHCHLSQQEFQDLVLKLTKKTGSRPDPNPSPKISPSAIINAVNTTVMTAAHPGAPIVLPIAAGVAISVGLYGVYRNAKIVQQLFIAYIVDLTNILETLAVLSAHGRNKLTRRAIKLAYKIYYESGLMAQAHHHVQDYHKLGGQDAASDMIRNLLDPERYGSADLREYYAHINGLDLAGFHLDREEEWGDR